MNFRKVGRWNMVSSQLEKKKKKNLFATKIFSLKKIYERKKK